MNQTCDVAAFGFGGGKPVSNRTLRKFRARRRVYDGYPWDGKFETIEQVNEYFSGDRITCLLCGRSLKKLGIHINKIHGTSDEKYRETFGIPWRRGLICEPTKETLSKNAVKRGFGQSDNKEYREKAHNSKHRKRCKAVLKLANDAFLKINGLTSPYNAQDAEEFARRILSGRSYGSVSSDADMPSVSWFYSFRKMNPEFDKQLTANIDALPFHIQAKIERLGRRFELELRKLFDAGFSDHKAAKALGVTAMTCNKFTKQWRETQNNGAPNRRD